MSDYVGQILISQFEAALCMLNECLQRCPPEAWNEKVARLTFRQVAYHTLFFVDCYLSPGEEAFELRELHRRGGDERQPSVSPGLSQSETIAYLSLCREKLRSLLGAETLETLQRPCGFARRQMSRGELHIYNLRHVQHHTGQLGAFLRRIDAASAEPGALPWVGSGWAG